MKCEMTGRECAGSNRFGCFECGQAALSCSAQSAGSNLALVIAEELVCDFSILNHDGNLTKGEHYWVGLDELKDYLEDCIRRNPNK